MKIEETKLKNEATIITCDIPDSKTVTISFGFRTGSRSETREISGASHYLEHMFFKGSKKFPNNKIISSTLDAIGANYNAYTSKEYTIYPIQVAVEHFDTALDIYGDMLTAPIIDEQEFNKERGTIIQEYHRSKDNPEYDLPDQAERTIFGDNSMGWNIVGSEESLKRMTVKDIKNYYEKYYNTSNLVVALVGKLPTDAITKVEKFVNKFANGKRTSWEKVDYSAKNIDIHNQKTGQSQIAIMTPGFSMGSTDGYVLEIIANILGGGMSARLFSEIREKRGWAYRVSAYNDQNSDNGVFWVIGGIKNDNVLESIEIIKKELLEFVKKLTEEEIEKAKGNISGLNAIKYENGLKRANFLQLTKLLTGKMETPEELIEKVKKVTRADIERVAQEIFKKEKLYVTVIGPFKDEEKFAKILA